MNRRPLLYIAGPYTHPDPVENTHRAARVGMAVWEEGIYTPIVPHLSLLWHMVTPRPIDTWYELDIAVLLHCDYIVRLPGASTGADREVEMAHRYDIPEIPFTDLPLTATAAWNPGT